MEYLNYLQRAAHYTGPGLYLVLAVLVAELLNLIAFRKLNGLGIVPRDTGSLAGVFFAPLLHDDLAHFAANFLPLCILVFLVGQLQPENFWWIVAAIVAGSGLLVWLLARHAVHIGASGLIYGLFGFIALSGFLSGSTWYLLASVAVLVLYSGILWGVLPGHARTSWESHLAGLAVGLGLAWWRVF